MAGLTLGMGRTKFVWIATAAAAEVNIGLVYLLVPDHGILAAAVASAIGYLALLLAIGWYSWNLVESGQLRMEPAPSGCSALSRSYTRPPS